MHKRFYLFFFLFLFACNNNITYSELELSQIKKADESGEQVEMEPGDTIQIVGKVEFSDGTSTTDVVWSSADNSVAKVDDKGRITAISPGNAEITVAAKSDPKQKSSVKIKVIPAKERKVGINVGTEGKLSKKELEEYNNSGKPANKNTGTTNTNSVQTNYTKASLSGAVFDLHGNMVENVQVKASSLDKVIRWSSTQNSVNGSFAFKDAPLGVILEIIATKSGWTERKKTEVLKSNNTEINFQEALAIQNEPEISEISFNSQKISGPGANIEFFDQSQPPEIISFTGVNLGKVNNVQIALVFSESMNKETVEKNLQLVSQKLSTGNSVTINPVSGFSWSNNDTKLSFPVNLQLDGVKRIIYRLQFKNNFADKDGLISLKDKSFAFINSARFSDYVAFSVY